MPAECYSSDLQQVKMEVNILYRIPEQSVVRIFQEYAGDPFDSLIAPRVQEALKEVAAAPAQPMSPRTRASLQIGLLVLLILGLLLLLPRALGFVEMAARELRYFWWLILFVALAVWLIWAGRRQP